jgi:hypothetical protein
MKNKLLVIVNTNHPIAGGIETSVRGFDSIDDAVEYTERLNSQFQSYTLAFGKAEKNGNNI